MIEFAREHDSLFCAAGWRNPENRALGVAMRIRVRATRLNAIKSDWISALLPQADGSIEIEIDESWASLRNGTMLVRVGAHGDMTFLNADTGQELLKEKPIHTLSIPSRYFKNLKGDLFHIEACFEAYDDEHIYGLGQHQHDRLDQKGCVIELIQRNTEVSIPFMLSSRGYGFLWNNPAVGRVELAQNATRWVAESSPQIDYWITTGENPAEILSNYADVTGHAPVFPEWASGFWQSKLRYASQAELEAVASGIPAAGSASFGNCDRLFPLDTPGRLDVRSASLARPGWDGKEIGRNGRKGCGIDLADREPFERQF